MADFFLLDRDLDRLWVVAREEANLNEHIRNSFCSSKGIVLVEEPDAKRSIADNNSIITRRFPR
jgi:hypothetical protein